MEGSNAAHQQRGAIAVALMLKMLAAAASFLITFSLARLLGAVETGHYALAIVTVTTVSQLALLGLDQLTVRIVAGDLREGKGRAARQALLRIGTLVGMMGAAAAVLLLFAAPLAYRIGLPPAFLPPVALAVLVFPLLRIAFAGLRAAGRVVSSQWLDGALFSGLVAAIALAALGGLVTFNALEFVQLWTLSVVLSTVVGWIVFARTARRWPGGASSDQRHIGFGSAWPIFLTVAATALTDWLVLAQLGAEGRAAEVGSFRVAFQIVLLISLIQVTVENIVAPRYAGDFRENDLRSARRRHRNFTLGMLIVSGPPIAVALIFAPHILRLFGPEFPVAADALRIMVLGQAINIATGPVGQFLIMAGKERATLWLAVAALLIAVAIGVVLTPQLGIVGAALAQASAVALRNAGGWAVMRHYLRHHRDEM